MIITTKNRWVFLLSVKPDKNEINGERLCSRILKGVVGNLKKLGLGFELNERRRRREGI